MRNRFSYRRPTWPSSTCSRRIRRRRSKRSASGLNTRAQDRRQKRPQRSIEMKGNAKDYVSTAQTPYGRESVVPIRGGIDVIWRTFPNAVPNFRVKVIELIPTDGNTVVIQ